MEYLTTIEMSQKWGITSRRIAVLCEQGRIVGVVKKGKTWLIPYDSEKPEDAIKKKETSKVIDILRSLELNDDNIIAILKSFKMPIIKL